MPTAPPTAVPQMMHQLVTLFNEILQEVKKEHETQMEQVRGAWKDIEQAKATVIQEKEQLERERKMFYQDVEKERERLGTLLTHGQQMASAPHSPSAGGGDRHSTPTRRLQPRGDVFSRLTDKTSYTGMYQRTPSPRHRAGHTTPTGGDVHNSGGRAFNHAKAFSTAPVQKYGVQVEGPFWITVWPGLERHGQPTRILLQHCRSMHQLIEKACKDTRVQPQPNALFTPDGRAVSNLSDVRPGLDYLVIPSGTNYREDCVPTALLQKLVMEGEAISEAVSQIQWSSNFQPTGGSPGRTAVGSRTQGGSQAQAESPFR
eukprot:PhF_6_TR9753/c0_g1_i1/m.15028